MKKLFFIASIMFLNAYALFSEVENISISNNLIFTPDVNIVEALTPEDNGLNLDDFLITENQTSRSERGNEDKISIGLLMNIKKNPYLGVESGFEVFPLIEAKYDKFFVKPNTIETVSGYQGGYIFYSDTQFMLSGIIDYQISNLDVEKLEAPLPSILEKKKSEFYFGLSGKFVPVSSPEFSIAVDVAKNFNNSGGLKVKFYGERYIQYTPLLYVVPGISYIFLDKDYINYYYGVPENLVNVTPYGDTPGNKFGAHLDLVYTLGENIDFRSINSIELLSTEIAESPLVTNRINLNIGIGIMFTF